MKLFGYEIKKAAPAIVEKAATKPRDNAVGFVGIQASSGMVEEEFLRTLRWPAAGRVYKEMASNDAVIGGCLYMLETLMHRSKWSVEPYGPDTKYLEDAAFVESCLHDMEDTWDDTLSEILTMMIYGFSFHEIVYKVRRGPDEKQAKFRSKYSDGKIGWQGMFIRSQGSLDTWTLDPKTGLATEFNQDTEVGKATIPLEGNLLFRTRSVRGNPEGESFLRRAYRSWYFKKNIEELEGIGLERNLAGIPVMRPDAETSLFNSDDPEMVKLLAWATNLVDGLRQDRNHGIILPHDWSLELLSTKSVTSIDADKIIRRYESRMAMSMLADVLLVGGDGSGSFALAESKQNLLTASLQALARRICDELNAVAIPRLFMFNGMPTDELPRIVTDNMQTVTVKDVALLLRAAGIEPAKSQELFNYLMHIINAPEITDPAILAAMAEGDRPTRGTQDQTGQDSIDNDLK